MRQIIIQYKHPGKGAVILGDSTNEDFTINDLPDIFLMYLIKVLYNFSNSEESKLVIESVGVALKKMVSNAYQPATCILEASTVLENKLFAFGKKCIIEVYTHSNRNFHIETRFPFLGYKAPTIASVSLLLQYIVNKSTTEVIHDLIRKAQIIVGMLTEMSFWQDMQFFTLNKTILLIRKMGCDNFIKEYAGDNAKLLETIYELSDDDQN